MSICASAGQQNLKYAEVEVHANLFLSSRPGFVGLMRKVA